MRSMLAAIYSIISAIQACTQVNLAISHTLRTNTLVAFNRRACDLDMPA